MNLTDRLGYFLGQCTAWVADNLGWIPAGLGNAGQWLANARAAGLPTGSVPAPGAVVEYAPGGGYSSFGHVGIVKSVDPGTGTFQVSEQNYTGPFQTDVRTSTMADVAGFIYPPGTNPQALNLAGQFNFPVNAATTALKSSIPLFDLPGFPGGIGAPADTLWRAGLVIVGAILILAGLIITFKGVIPTPEV